MANDFGKFFRDKINSIRLEIASQGSTSDVSESHFALDGPSFSEFRLFSETEVHELIKSSTKTTCSLDQIVLSFLLSVVMYYLIIIIIIIIII